MHNFTPLKINWFRKEENLILKCNGESTLTSLCVNFLENPSAGSRWTFTGNAELSSGWELRTQQELKNLKEHRTDTEAAGKYWKIHFFKTRKDTLETHRVLQIPSMNKWYNYHTDQSLANAVQELIWWYRTYMVLQTTSWTSFKGCLCKQEYNT